MQHTISVITIVYNDQAHILETMDSVILQDYAYIEYIIIDGQSKDNTVQKIESKITSIANITQKKLTQNCLYIQAVLDSNPHFSFIFISEKDSGIYDAMNKGIDLASGKWCNFMNSGDRFYNERVLGCVVAEMQKLNEAFPAVLYGNTQIIYDKHNTKIIYAAPSERKNAHKYHHHFIHQSAFIATDILKQYKYDTHFKIAGDTDFFTKIYNKGYVFKKIDCIVSAFNAEGVSGRLSWQMFIEDCKIGCKYNVLFPLYYTLRYVFWIVPRVLVRNAIPMRFRNKARVLLGKKQH